MRVLRRPSHAPRACTMTNDTAHGFRSRTTDLGPRRNRPGARTRPGVARGLQGRTAGRRPRSSRRAPMCTRQPARCRWSASTRSPLIPTKSSAISRDSRNCRQARCRRRAIWSIAPVASSRIFLDELVGGANPVPLKLFPEYELMQQARGVKGASPTDLFFPDLSPRAPKIATLEVGHAAEAFLLPHQAAPAVPARPARVAARRRGRREDHARCRPGHRGRADAFGAAFVLVDRRRAARKHRRKGRRKRIRRQAAVRTRRPADPALRRRLGEGLGPDAPRGALLRRDQRAGRRRRCRPCSAPISLQWPDPDCRSAVGRRPAHAAAAARGPRAAGQRQGSLAEDHRRSSGKHREAEADDGRPARPSARRSASRRCRA